MTESSKESPVDKLGERLQALRASADETQDVVAAAVGVNTGTYSRWERGSSKPHAAELVALARHFGVSTDHLLLGDPLPNDAIPRELHRFLNTPNGRYADRENLVPMLRDMKFPFPPTLQTYNRIVKTWRIVNDDDDDFGDEEKSQEKPRKKPLS